MDPLKSAEDLQNISLFNHLTRDQLYMLAAQFKQQSFFPGQDIVHQGDLGNRFFVVEQGLVNLLQTDADGFEKSLGVLPTPQSADLKKLPRAYFGEQMFTTQEPYDFRAHTLVATQVLYIERGDFDALMLAHPDLRAVLPFIVEAEKKRTRGYKWVDAGESVALVARKHWWALLSALVPALIGLVVALAITGVIVLGGLGFLTVVIVIAWVLWLGFVGLQLYDWRNDEYIITNQRIAHIERELLTFELRESIPIGKIQGVAIERGGVSGWLGVSNLTIQSAGREEGGVTFRHVGNAAQIRQTIQSQQEPVRARQLAEERERRRQKIQEELREYILPDIVAQERAIAATAVKTPLPIVRRGLRQQIRRAISFWLSLEVRQGSVVIWRKHWIVLFRQSARWVLGLIALDLFLLFYVFVPGLQVIPYGGYLFGGLTLLAICLAGVWWEWTDWRNDTYAITDTQIIDAERVPLGLREKTITAPLDQVQDVRVDVPGVLAFLLNFGDVKIETAGKGGQMIFYSIHNPRSAADEIFHHLEQYRARRAEREASINNQGVVDALLGYHRLLKEEGRVRQGGTSTAPTPPPAASESGSPLSATPSDSSSAEDSAPQAFNESDAKPVA